MADPTPTQTTYYNVGFTPEIAPYAKTVLGQAQALTDTTYNPYQQYQGERQAQFSPLQQMSFENAALMQTAPQLQDASALSGLAGLGALNTQYTFKPADFASTFTKDAQGNVTSPLMSPYMDAVVARQQQDATRQAAIAQQAQQANAARSGAFGGSGDYIMRGQAAANLARQKGDIQAQGLQNAYQQAMQQFNLQNQLNAQQQQFGAGLGLQGLQTALSGANTLGQLGQQQFGQAMDINKLQNLYGGQQQQQAQQDLTNKYQDFLNYQNYPYKQLGFMSDMIRGLPTAQTGSTMYQAPGSMLGQIAGLGIGASKLGLKEGGSVDSYAEGGSIARPNEEQLANMVDSLSDQQLQQIIQHPTSIAELRAAQEEMALRASTRRGIASAAHGGMMERMMPTEESMRRGGVVAFADGDAVKDDTSQFKSDITNVVKSIAAAIPAGPKDNKWMDEYFTLPAAEYQKRRAARDAERAKASAPAASTTANPYDPATATRRVDYEDKTKSKPATVEGPISEEAKNVINTGAVIAQKSGVNKDDYFAQVKSLMAELKAGNADDLKNIRDAIGKSATEAKSIRDAAQDKAIRDFGFGLAAEAAKPGQPGNTGIRGLLRSSAAAAPIISQSMDESEKLARDLDKNQRAMEIEYAKYKVALDKNDQQTALGIMSNLKQMEHYDNQLKVQLAELAQKGQYYNMMGGKYKAAEQNALLKRGQLNQNAYRLAQKEVNDLMRNDLQAAMEYKNKGITPEMLIKKRQREIYGDTLASMTSGLTPEED